MRTWHAGCKRFLLFLMLGLVNSQMDCLIRKLLSRIQIRHKLRNMIKEKKVCKTASVRIPATVIVTSRTKVCGWL